MKLSASNNQILIGKVIQFTNEVEEHEIDFDSGMFARIKDIRTDTPDVYKFLFDFSEFEEHNLTKMKSNYYDSNGNPCETWAQQKWYNKEKISGAQVYLQFANENTGELLELPFELAEPPKKTSTITPEQVANYAKQDSRALKEVALEDILEEIRIRATESNTLTRLDVISATHKLLNTMQEVYENSI